MKKYSEELETTKLTDNRKKLNLLDFLLRDKIDGPAKFKKLKIKVYKVRLVVAFVTTRFLRATLTRNNQSKDT